MLRRIERIAKRENQPLFVLQEKIHIPLNELCSNTNSYNYFDINNEENKIDFWKKLYRARVIYKISNLKNIR